MIAFFSRQPLCSATTALERESHNVTKQFFRGKNKGNGSCGAKSEVNQLTVPWKTVSDDHLIYTWVLQLARLKIAAQRHKTLSPVRPASEISYQAPKAFTNKRDLINKILIFSA